MPDFRRQNRKQEKRCSVAKRANHKQEQKSAAHRRDTLDEQQVRKMNEQHHAT